MFRDLFKQKMPAQDLSGLVHELAMRSAVNSVLEKKQAEADEYRKEAQEFMKAVAEMFANSGVASLLGEKYRTRTKFEEEGGMRRLAIKWDFDDYERGLEHLISFSVIESFEAVRIDFRSEVKPEHVDIDDSQYQKRKNFTDYDPDKDNVYEYVALFSDQHSTTLRFRDYDAFAAAGVMIPKWFKDVLLTVPRIAG